jgi:serine/threonine protein kinase
VSDFGLAKVKEESQSTCINSGGGTMAWMAPGDKFANIFSEFEEVLRGKSVTKAADVYSFAVIVWEMLTKELPWKGNIDVSNNKTFFSGLNIAQITGIVGFQGERLQIPPSCHSKLHKLLDSCFSDQRPTFEDIIILLRFYHYNLGLI